MRRHPWRDSCVDIPDLLSRLSRLKLSARLCNFIPIRMRRDPWSDSCPDFPDLIPRLCRPYAQIFQTQTLGATLQFGSESGCGAALGAIHVQTFQTV